MHTLQSTTKEEDYNPDSAHRKSWREVFGVQEVADCDHCGELLTDKDRDNTDGHDTLGFFVKCDTCKKPLRLCEWCWDNSDDCCECEAKAEAAGAM